MLINCPDSAKLDRKKEGQPFGRPALYARYLTQLLFNIIPQSVINTTLQTEAADTVRISSLFKSEKQEVMGLHVGSRCVCEVHSFSLNHNFLQ